MSHRHTPRQSERERERDVRLHDPHPAHHAYSLPPPSHAHGPHLNGNGIPPTPTAVAGPAHAAGPSPMVVSPQALAAAAPNGVSVPASVRKLAEANEQTWLLIGRVAEQMGNLEHALSAYENVLRHNPMSLPGLTQVAGIARIKENYPKAVEYFQRVIGMQQDNGEVWSALGHCYLMQDDLQKAYAAYQQALYLLPNPKEDPKLWYGIGILYDRYGSLDHAEEAFASVLRMDKDFDKANEILFRLGIIYKQQGKYEESLSCFERILRSPPNPLAHADIWFQIGHVHEQQRNHLDARRAYERVVQENPNHAKVLQQLGWLYHQDGSSFQNQDLAIQYLTKSLEADPSDAQSWYLLGRAYMAGQKYNKAYEAYQQAVYRDGRNPTFWCSIGVLYFQINQYRDALDAYSRAIRINPYISEVWFDLGSLYESCNNQISDAIDAYARAAELDPGNAAITQRLQLLRQAQTTGVTPPAAPGPQDVHPTAYANPMMPPAGLSGPPMLMQAGGNRPIFRTDSRGAQGDLPLPVLSHHATGRSSPGPFRGGPPPPVILDDTRHALTHPPLAPMDIDRPPQPHHREHPASYPPPPRENGPRGPNGQGLLLHHPVPTPNEPLHSHRRMPSASASPPPPAHLAAYERPGPALRRTPPPGAYPRDEREGWERRPPISIEQAEWERERERRARASEYPHTPAYYSRQQSRGPSPRGPRERSPETSPRSAYPGYRHPPAWDKPPTSGPGVPRSPPPTRAMLHEPSGSRRYDPTMEGREPPMPREYERERERDIREREIREREREMAEQREPRYMSPDVRGRPPPPPSHYPSESPRMPQQVVQVGAAEPKAPAPPRRRVNGGKDKDAESVSNGSTAGDAPKKERKRRPAKRVKEEQQRAEYAPAPSMTAYRKTGTEASGSPEPSNGSSGRSVQPSPTGSAPLPPARVVDEDYDEGVADALMDLAGYRGAPEPRVFARPAARSPPTSHSSRSPPLGTKRPLSPAPSDEHVEKRSRVGGLAGRPPSHSVSSNSNSNGRPTPTPSMRPSPIPFHQQPTHSPDRPPTHNGRSYPPSPTSGPGVPPVPAPSAAASLPSIPLPPHPRPIGVSGHAHAQPMGLSSMHAPPSPVREREREMAAMREREREREDRDERMHSSSPRAPKREIVLHAAGGSAPASAGGSPPSKNAPSPASSHGRAGPVP